MKYISIIIPNYNGKHYLESIMPVLVESEHEIIIIDNASTDGSIEFLQENFSEVILILNDDNMGFSVAVNQGIKRANSEYILLLNNDTEFELEAFDKMIRVMNTDKNIFSVASKMVQYHDKNLIDTAGDEYNIFGWAYKRGYNMSSETRINMKRVFSSCAGAALYRKSVFEKIGYFDEGFFAYMEDVDVGYRANIFGYKNIYCPEALIYHIGSGTSGSGRNAFKAKLSGRNNVYVAYKNMPLVQLLLNLPFLTLGFFIKYIFFSRHGLGKVYIAGVLEGIKTLSSIEKVPFRIRNLRNYLWIEWRLIVNTFGFVINRFK